MIGIIYETKTGKLKRTDVPDTPEEEAVFNGAGLPTKEDESFIVFGDDLAGLTPNMHAIQKLLNEKLGLDPYSNDVPKDY